MHPHAQRQLALALENIAAAPGYQVFACSHSTHFVNLDQYKSLTIVSKNDPEEGTIVRQCCVDLFEGEGAKDRKDRFHLASWVNPDRGEMFYAKKVVFVEGETEKTILPFLADKLGLSDPSVSIIDCGAKHNLPLYIAVANVFKLEYVVVHDEDPLPDPIPPEWSKDTERAKKRTFALNAEIDTNVDRKLGSVLVLRPDFEEAAGVSRSQGHKKGKALAALGHFAEQTEDQIPEQLKNLVQSIYG